MAPAAGTCRLTSFCRETAIRRRSNPSLTVGALMVSLKLRDLESEPRPLGSVLTRGNRVSRQKLAKLERKPGEESVQAPISGLLDSGGQPETPRPPSRRKRRARGRQVCPLCA